MKNITATAITFGVVLASAPAVAATCKTDTPVDDMTYEDAGKLYDCLEESMAEGYRKGPKQWIPKSHVDDYRNWTRASTLPANPGFHGERYLATWVNDVGIDQYLKYEEEGFTMPVGTLIAKESFSVGKDGTAKAGPLFLMEKVEAGKSPKTNDWYYMMVSPAGVPQGVNVFVACNECHGGPYGEADHMAYPEEEVRVRK